MTQTLEPAAGCSLIPAAGITGGRHPTAPTPRFPAAVGGLLLRAVDGLMTWQRRAIDRRSLGSLDDRMLRDIGLSRADIEQEITKPFWRA